MTSILNKLVSACEKIEANAGSGGSSDSDIFTCDSITIAELSSSEIFIPLTRDTARDHEAKIFIRIEGEDFPRYYIEYCYVNDKVFTKKTFTSIKVNKNLSAPSDSVNLGFTTLKCTLKEFGDICIGVKVTGLDTVSAEKIHLNILKEMNGGVSALSTYDITKWTEGDVYNGRFIPQSA